MRWQNTITIDAPAARVWDLTLDITGWPAITPTMKRVVRLDDGPLRVGSSARIRQPGQTAAVWTVTRLEPGREFTWQTRRLGVTMVGRHLVEDLGHTCRNTLALEVDGPGARLFGWLFGRAFANALATENAGFQKAATAAPAPR